MWSLIGRGSYFAGTPTPRDADFLCITDDPDATRESELHHVEPFLDDAPPCLPIDLSIVHPDDLSPFVRAIVHTGVLLDGEDLRGRVTAPSWPLYAHYMASVAQQYNDIGKWPDCGPDPARAAIAALQAIQAPEGFTSSASRWLAVKAAEGTRWESLADAAWAERPNSTPAPFSHPDLDAALDTAARTAAGDGATDDEWEEAIWSGWEERAAIVACYRNAIPDAVLAEMAATPTDRRQQGGWSKSPAPTFTEVLAEIACVANAQWFREPIAAFEPAEVHRYPTGAVFLPHIDRYPRKGCSTRRLATIGMVREADAGGLLLLNAGGRPIDPALEPGDVFVMLSTLLHQVTEITAGERITVVAHARVAERA